ncbi:MAG: hypothetical protein GY938_12980 [Ketobacter sp.]|nr:hypothetical protein [Ketobacter sp.]
MGINTSLPNNADFVARDRIEKVAFQVPGEQDLHIQLLGDNIHQMSNYVIEEEYFPGSDGSRYLMKRVGRVDIFTWSNLLGRFAMWGMQQNEKWVAQVYGHTSALMFNERSTMRAVPIGQGQSGVSLMHVSLVNRCPRQQIYRGHDILAGLPWIKANVQNVGGEYRLYYESTGIPYYYWFDENPTWNTTSYTWDVSAAGNVNVRVPWCLEGTTVAMKGNDTGIPDANWILEALDDSLAVLASTLQSVSATLLCPTGTRYLQMRSTDLVSAKTIQQPAIQLVTHGTASVDPEVYVDPRSLNIVVAPS